VTLVLVRLPVAVTKPLERMVSEVSVQGHLAPLLPGSRVVTQDIGVECHGRQEAEKEDRKAQGKGHAPR
jgi:hypothetical protein